MRGSVQAGGCRVWAPSPSLLLSDSVRDAFGDASSWDSPWHRSVLEPPFHHPLQPHLSPRDARGPRCQPVRTHYSFFFPFYRPLH